VEQGQQEKTLLFELSLKLLASKKSESAKHVGLKAGLGSQSKHPMGLLDDGLKQTGSEKKKMKAGEAPRREVTVTEAIEEFLESDFEISASNAARKAMLSSKRFAMFSPSKLFSPLFNKAGAGQEEHVYDPYLNKSQLSVFENPTGAAFKAALLLHNFTTIVCVQDPESLTEHAVEDDPDLTIYILAKSHSNQLYRVSSGLQTIEKWLTIDHEITLLTIANGYLLIQDEYAAFYLVQADFKGSDHLVTKIELDGQPSASLLQNVSFSAPMRL